MDLFLKKNRPLDLFYIIYFQVLQSKDRDFIHCDVLQDSTCDNSFQKSSTVQFERRSKALKTFGRIPYLMGICEKFNRINKNL